MKNKNIRVFSMLSFCFILFMFVFTSKLLSDDFINSNENFKFCFPINLERRYSFVINSRQEYSNHSNPHKIEYELVGSFSQKAICSRADGFFKIENQFFTQAFFKNKDFDNASKEENYFNFISPRGEIEVSNKSDHYHYLIDLVFPDFPIEIGDSWTYVKEFYTLYPIKLTFHYKLLGLDKIGEKEYHKIHARVSGVNHTNLTPTATAQEALFWFDKKNGFLVKTEARMYGISKIYEDGKLVLNQTKTILRIKNEK